ncbi:hypothetical protein TB2_031678 [Malus domestica]
MMQKTMILAAESMLIDQEDTKATKEITTTMAAEAYSSVERIKKLESKLVALKGSRISTLQVIHFKKIVDRLETYVLELQGALKINENLKKEVDKLQHVHVGLLEENKQLKGEKVRLEASLVQSQANFYKLGYVDNLFGKLSDFKFARKDFETFCISSEDFLAFTFEASIGEMVGEVSAQARVARGEVMDDAAIDNVEAIEGVATE